MLIYKKFGGLLLLFCIFLFSFYNTYRFIQSFITFAEAHLHFITAACPVGGTSLRCRVKIRTRACYTASRAMQSELRCTLIGLCCTLSSYAAPCWYSNYTAIQTIYLTLKVLSSEINVAENDVNRRKIVTKFARLPCCESLLKTPRHLVQMLAIGNLISNSTHSSTYFVEFLKIVYIFFDSNVCDYVITYLASYLQKSVFSGMGTKNSNFCWL